MEMQPSQYCDYRLAGLVKTKRLSRHWRKDGEPHRSSLFALISGGIITKRCSCREGRGSAADEVVLLLSRYSLRADRGQVRISREPHQLKGPTRDRNAYFVVRWITHRWERRHGANGKKLGCSRGVDIYKRVAHFSSFMLYL